MSTDVCKAVNATDDEREKVTVHYDIAVFKSDETCHDTDKSESTALDESRISFKHCESSPSRQIYTPYIFFVYLR